MHETKQDEEPVESVEEIVDKGMKKEKDLSDGLEEFDIEISNEARGITIKIQCREASDAIFISGWVISAFKKLDIPAQSKVMP